MYFLAKNCLNFSLPQPCWILFLTQMGPKPASSKVQDTMPSISNIYFNFYFLFCRSGQDSFGSPVPTDWQDDVDEDIRKFDREWRENQSKYHITVHAVRKPKAKKRNWNEEAEYIIMKKYEESEKRNLFVRDPFLKEENFDKAREREDSFYLYFYPNDSNELNRSDDGRENQDRIYVPQIRSFRNSMDDRGIDRSDEYNDDLYGNEQRYVDERDEYYDDDRDRDYMEEVYQPTYAPDTPLILLWDNPWYVPGAGPPEGTQYGACTLTYQRRFAEEAKALVFQYIVANDVNTTHWSIPR